MQTPLHPTFTRSPRQYVSLPRDEVEIQSPPHAPNKPMVSLWMTMLPLGMMILLAIVTAFIMNSSSSGFWMYSMVFSIGSGLVGVISYFAELSRFKKESENREVVYQKYLIRQKQVIEELRRQQHVAMFDSHPDVQECLTRALRLESEKARRLWERSEGNERLKRDTDFLDLRLGIGRAHASYKIKLQTPPSSMIEPDMLTKQGHALVEKYAWLDGVPVTLQLEKATALGIGGSRKAVQDVTRSLLIQLATHHSPNEVKVVIIFSESERSQWEWARWLPHVWSDDHKQRYMACDPDQGQALLSKLAGQLRQRHLQRQSEDNKTGQFSPSYVFIFADPSILGSSENNSTSLLLNTLLTEGHALNAYPLFLADRPENLPKACGAIIDLTGRDQKMIVVGPPTETTTFLSDFMDIADAEMLSRSLMPLRARQMATANDLPALVTLLATLGVEKVEDLNALDRWEKHNPVHGLSAPVGMRAGNDIFELDLHEKGQGPNGLVAGTVGSGKTELVQSLVASLAVNFHPYDVAFALLDFKGGDMVAPLRNFPHVLSTITSLEMDTVPRAITSLAAELDRREKIFEKVRKQFGQDISHIDEYISLYKAGKVAAPLPYLILIVDEFAVLKSTFPDEMEKFVRIAIKGRSLGFRMILATQRPQGVVSEQIDANSRLRLCLRVARVEDSQEILKRPDAANLSGVGRTYIRVGEHEMFDLFQASWGGAPYEPGSAQQNESSEEIFIVESNGTRRKIWPAQDKLVGGISISSPISQLQAIGEYLNTLVTPEEITKLQVPWLSPLPNLIELDQVRAQGKGWNGMTWVSEPIPDDPVQWLAPAVGLVDDPADQSQQTLTIPLGKAGHLAIYGAPGSGKTTFLQTLVVSSCLQYSPAELNIYMVDCGGHNLDAYKGFPHVGAIMTSMDEGRITRLLSMLSKEIERRKEILGKYRVNTLHEFLKTGNSDLPEVVVLMDNLPEFLSLYPNLQVDLERLSQGGGNLGIHLVITSPLVGGLPPRIANNLSQVIALELNDASDYPQLVGRNAPHLPSGVRGRGVVRGYVPLEFQTAVYRQPGKLEDLMTAMHDSWKGKTPLELPSIPEILALTDIVVPSAAGVMDDGKLSFPVGLDIDSVQPVRVNLADGPHFMIAGPSGSGKTSLLHTILLGLASRYDPKRLGLLLVGTDNADLAQFSRLPHVLEFIDDYERLNAILENLETEALSRRKRLDESRKQGGTSVNLTQSLVIVIDDFDMFSNDTAKSHLENLLKLKNIGLHALIAGNISGFTSGYSGPEKVLRESRTGFLLESNEADALGLFGIKLDYEMTKKPLPRGRGYCSLRGRHKTVQFATPYFGTHTISDWLKSLSGRFQ